MRTNLINNENVKSEVPVNDGMLDMVIAFDTTGSMISYIGAVKEHVKELVPKLFKQNPDLRMGIVAFGDYCDMPSKDEFGKAYQVCELTDNENKLIEFITNVHNTNGGDSDEFYELVIKKIVEETDWREDSTKAVLLIADAHPHKVGYSYDSKVVNSQIDWREEAKKAAEKGIKFDTLTINDYEWYKELSKITKDVSAPSVQVLRPLILLKLLHWQEEEAELKKHIELQWIALLQWVIVKCLLYMRLIQKK